MMDIARISNSNTGYWIFFSVASTFASMFFCERTCCAPLRERERERLLFRREISRTRALIIIAPRRVCSTTACKVSGKQVHATRPVSIVTADQRRGGSQVSANKAREMRLLARWRERHGTISHHRDHRVTLILLAGRLQTRARGDSADHGIASERSRDDAKWHSATLRSHNEFHGAFFHALALITNLA